MMENRRHDNMHEPIRRNGYSAGMNKGKTRLDGLDGLAIGMLLAFLDNVKGLAADSAPAVGRKRQAVDIVAVGRKS